MHELMYLPMHYHPRLSTFSKLVVASVCGIFPSTQLPRVFDLAHLFQDVGISRKFCQQFLDYVMDRCGTRQRASNE